MYVSSTASRFISPFLSFSVCLSPPRSLSLSLSLALLCSRYSSLYIPQHYLSVSLELLSLSFNHLLLFSFGGGGHPSLQTICRKSSSLLKQLKKMFAHEFPEKKLNVRDYISFHALRTHGFIDNQLVTGSPELLSAMLLSLSLLCHYRCHCHCRCPCHLPSAIVAHDRYLQR